MLQGLHIRSHSCVGRCVRSISPSAMRMSSLEGPLSSGASTGLYGKQNSLP